MGYKLCGVLDLMDDTLLDFRFWKDCFHCLGKSGKTVYAGDQDILYTTVFLTT